MSDYNQKSDFNKKMMESTFSTVKQIPEVAKFIREAEEAAQANYVAKETPVFEQSNVTRVEGALRAYVAGRVAEQYGRYGIEGMTGDDKVETLEANLLREFKNHDNLLEEVNSAIEKAFVPLPSTQKARSGETAVIANSAVFSKAHTI